MNYCSSCRSDEKVRRRARANSESALVMEQPSKRRRRIQRSAIEIACAMRTVSSRQVRPAMDTLRPTCAVFNHRCATITQVGGLDENANCARTRASFRLLGDRLDPVFVTERLGLHPTRAMSKSEEIPAGKSGEAHRRRTGVWLLESEATVTSTSLERHVVWLLEQVEPSRDALATVRAALDLRADFFCYWVSKSGDGGPEISPTTLRRIAELDAPLGIDFYDDSAA
jgi:hypothetical protein